jgi:hypothetical protein
MIQKEDGAPAFPVHAADFLNLLIRVTSAHLNTVAMFGKFVSEVFELGPPGAMLLDENKAVE